MNVPVVSDMLARQFPRPDPSDQAARTEIVIRLRKSIVKQWVFILGLTIVVLWLAVTLKQQTDRIGHLLQNGRKAAITTQHQAHVQCVRTRTIAPYLAKDYARRHALPPKILREYTDLIPKSC